MARIAWENRDERSARPEWQVFGEVAVPLYKGIDTLCAKGDQIQWGGRTIYADGRFATPDGKAHFDPVSPRVRLKSDATYEVNVASGYEANVASGFSRTLQVSTSRGKQFKSL